MKQSLIPGVCYIRVFQLQCFKLICLPGASLELTLVHVVVFPLPCKPTNMMILGLPLTGCQAGTPGSSNWEDKIAVINATQRVSVYFTQFIENSRLDNPAFIKASSHFFKVNTFSAKNCCDNTFC